MDLSGRCHHVLDYVRCPTPGHIVITTASLHQQQQQQRRQRWNPARALLISSIVRRASKTSRRVILSFRCVFASRTRVKPIKMATNTMDAIKKKMQAMKGEKDNALEKADQLEQRVSEQKAINEKVLKSLRFIYILVCWQHLLLRQVRPFVLSFCL